MYSQYLKNSSAKAVSRAITFVLALFLQGMAIQANADDIVASFERMLNPGEAVGQSATTYRAERDPLYTMVNVTLWNVPTNQDSIALSFEHMLNTIETAVPPAVAHREERDPLYKMVNATLWSAPTYQDSIAASLVAYAQP